MKQVEFWIDGRLRSVDLAPLRLRAGRRRMGRLRGEEAGAHTLTVKAVGATGHASEQTITVFVR